MPMLHSYVYVTQLYLCYTTMSMLHKYAYVTQLCLCYTTMSILHKYVYVTQLCLCYTAMYMLYNYAYVTQLCLCYTTVYVTQLSMLYNYVYVIHTVDQLVIRFIRFYSRLTSSDNAIVSFIARLAISNKHSYLRSNILYIKWKYGADITKTDIHECINFVHQNCQTNAELISLIGMLNQLIDTRDGFKVIPNLGRNEIIEYIISISTISLS